MRAVIAQIYDYSVDGISAEDDSSFFEFCRALPELAGVVAVPLSAFCHPAYAAETASLVRFAFCKRPEVLKEALSRLSVLSR